RLGRHGWGGRASARGADRFPGALGSGLSPPRVAVVGPGTAASVRAPGVEPTLVPERFVAEGLLAAFPPGPGRILLPQAEGARPVLAAGLRAAGWDVDAVVAYRTVTSEAAPVLVERARRADAITFTSGSTVTGYVAAAGPDALPPIVACIGPVTAAAAEAAGIPVTTVAAEHTIDGLIAALETALAP